MGTKATLKISGEEIEYTLRRSARAKYMRLAIHRDGDIVMTVPTRLAQYICENFIESKAKWILSKIKHVKQLPKVQSKVERRNEYLFHKERARALVTDRLEYFNQYYRYTWNRISIRNTKSRWGSCSKKGNLNFNYKIALIDRELADYIIVHELCHLRELNHSLNFWNLVSKAIPNYVILRKQLKVII